ncbi:MAG: hypothetical protein ACI9CE_002029 [Flavobacterium sp.]|jgi:hypothetical protein
MNFQKNDEHQITRFDSVRIKREVKACIYGQRTLGRTLSIVCRDYGFSSEVTEIAVKEYLKSS